MKKNIVNLFDYLIKIAAQNLGFFFLIIYCLKDKKVMDINPTVKKLSISAIVIERFFTMIARFSKSNEEILPSNKKIKKQRKKYRQLRRD